MKMKDTSQNVKEKNNIQPIFNQSEKKEGWITNESYPKSTYFEEMKPMFITLFLLGRLPVKFTQHGMEKCKLMSVPVFYTVVSTLFQILLSITAINHIVEFDLIGAIKSDVRPYFLALIIILSMNFSIPFTSWPDTNSNTKFSRNMASFQEEFMWTVSRLNSSSPSAWIEIFIAESRGSRRSFIKIMSYINFPFVSLIISTITLYLIDMPIHICAPFVLIFMGIFSAVLLWCMNCYYLTRFGDILSEQTIKAIKTGTAEELNWCRLTWCKLSHLVRSMGFSYQYTAILGNIIMGVSFVITCYAALDTYYSSRFSKHMMGILVGLPFSSYIIYITFKSAHDVTKKIGSTFATSLLSQDLSHLSTRQCKEVEYLLQCLQLIPPVIKVADFVTLDKSLITSFASNAITYLIVLIQFSGPGDKRFSPPNSNVTSSI